MIEIAPMSKNKMTYDEAVLYCQFLDYNGHTDWRLPTKDDHADIWGWHESEVDPIIEKWYVYPVRDI
jgi:hypothetical protein